jgi:hypothetical protein
MLSMSRWPLLPELGYALMVEGAAEGAADRFGKVFRATWSRLPDTAKKGLRTVCDSFGDDLPRFLLLNTLEPHRTGEATFGVYNAGRFHFSAAELQQLKNQNHLAEALIAHELAHCVLDHRGGYSDANEKAAGAPAESWGFPMKELRAAISRPAGP